eukprot:SAG31_NODE_8659_length_1411_cov_2.022104_2_plen_81_part_00
MPCSTAGVDDSHGLAHALKVLENLDGALAATKKPIPQPRKQAMRLAALLHDADDRKYFPGSAKTYANAEELAKKAGASSS